MSKAFVLTLLFYVIVPGVRGQADSPLPLPSQVAFQSQQAAISRAPSLTIKVRSNLVQVRVVVRDADGKPVSGLSADDFKIFDEHVLQTIRSFSVETPELRTEKEAPLPRIAVTPSVRTPTIAMPERFVALVFDDANLTPENTVQIKKAATLFLRNATGSDRIGVFSTSGQVTQDFTSDIAALRRSVLRIVPHSLIVTNDRQCPNVSYDLARQIEEYHDAEAAVAVTNETLKCAFAGDPVLINAARALAQSAIHQALRIGHASITSVFRHLEDVLLHLSQKPGERVMVLLSPGFLHIHQPADEWQIADLANRANIVINTLDVRGLNVPDSGEEASKRSTDLIETRDIKVRERENRQLEQTSVLAGFAYGTGGTFFRNSNDLLGGLKLAASPEICYVLGFAPSNLKQDGSHHTLEVRLTGTEKYSIQARRGYYAPRQAGPGEQEEREIADELHSRVESGNLFLDLQAHPQGNDPAQPQVIIISTIAVNNIRFKEADGKHTDVLRVITAIFDENGIAVSGGEKQLTMELNDTQHQKLIQAGLTVNSRFELKPGRYLVRQVIRDTATEEMSARNQVIEIAK